ASRKERPVMWRVCGGALSTLPRSSTISVDAPSFSTHGRMSPRSWLGLLREAGRAGFETCFFVEENSSTRLVGECARPNLHSSPFLEPPMQSLLTITLVLAASFSQALGDDP